jgi:hypothetical protein
VLNAVARHASQAAARCSQHAWGVLAQLPRLARLHLDVHFNYHSDMPAGGPLLPALTHLAVFSDATMAMPDRRRNVEVPFLAVRALASYASFPVLGTALCYVAVEPCACFAGGTRLLVSVERRASSVELHPRLLRSALHRTARTACGGVVCSARWRGAVQRWDIPSQQSRYRVGAPCVSAAWCNSST